MIPLNDLIEQYMPNLKAALTRKKSLELSDIRKMGRSIPLPQIGDKEAGYADVCQQALDGAAEY